MGFNEPNNLHNCNTSPEDVAKAWAFVQQRWKGSKLVSPATAGNGIKWLSQFFGNCSKLGLGDRCGVSYVAVHDYSCTAKSTLSYLQDIHERFGKPVWLTEFSCGVS